MKEIRRKNFVYTLVEDDQGRYFFELLVPAPMAASALYDLRVRVSSFQKWMIKIKPDLADGIAERLIRQEKERQIECF
jgi:hypothetical protein